jgi:hypothetical protein
MHPDNKWSRIFIMSAGEFWNGRTEVSEMGKRFPERNRIGLLLQTKPLLGNNSFMARANLIVPFTVERVAM